MKNPLNSSEMGHNFFNSLPSEVIIEILSRLPIPTIIACKFVCRPWLNLIHTPEFAKIHLSKSVPGLAVHERSARGLTRCNFFEFEDSLDLEQHELHYNPITKFDLPYPISRFHPSSEGLIEGSVNGLFFVRHMCFGYDALVIYNPITRDYIELDCPRDLLYEHKQIVGYGFGVSKMSCQYKVVRILYDFIFDEVTGEKLRISKSECHIYTLGTGLWRRIESVALLGCSWRTSGVFLNGNLHWFVDDLNGSTWISCFDLQTEVFSTFSTPFHPDLVTQAVGLSALGDYLCLCDNSYAEKVVVIWLMKEYGDEKSWAKEFVISQDLHFWGHDFKVVYPVKIFKDGDILILWQLFDKKIPVYYSNKAETMKVMNMPFDDVNGVLHTSTFLSLKSFANENARSFKYFTFLE